MSDQKPLLEHATRDLAQFAAALTYDEIPPDVIAHIKLCILDGLGAGLYGAQLPWTKRVQAMVLNEGATPRAFMWGTGRKVSVAQAALVNSTAGHGFEMDDIHKESILHPNSLAVPSTFAWAQGHPDRPNGRELLTAVVAGCEVGIRVGNAATMSLFLRGFHPQGTSGVFVSAAACGRLAGLAPDQLQHALGIAGSMAAGLMAAQEGAMVKRLHAGRAAQGGVQAVMLAAEGFTGITDVIEAGYGGFLSSFSASPNAAKITAGLGHTWETRNIGFKMYPNVTSIHSALDGFEAIMRENNLDADSIDSVDIHCPHMTYVHTAWPYKPAGVTAAQMNMFYGIAATAVAGRVSANEYSEEMLTDARILAFIDRIKVTESTELEAKGAAYRHASLVRLRRRDGKTFERETLHRRGSPENPVAREDILRKFQDNVRHLPSAVSERIIALVDTIETGDSLGDLVEILGAEHRAAAPVGAG
ncbi:MmgE/PrpD family protein [Bradyrhizobium sp. LHD-71]|uniref:MmgE/PrpD family protein n=1 Tax=Bradyrhizobium sp. LHD-71 TaxID=3072141 RepID=UPI00280C8F99|nr:MmgE/PrpD family protein [Bradyrhizobium sp. LHD-71]MDQ8727844.1 MmgE/PrpD family protein [Bradyrhizobium sp. LHD-71]